MKVNWRYVLDSWWSRFCTAAVIAGAIVIDSLLFTLWFYIDYLVSCFIEWAHVEHDFNSYIALAFRIMASGTAFGLAFLHALADIIQGFIEVCQKARDTWVALIN
jgi:hypothetical protein